MSTDIETTGLPGALGITTSDEEAVQLDGLCVVHAVLGQQRSLGIKAALERAGATVRTTFNLADACRTASDAWQPAVVIVDTPDTTQSIHDSLRALSRRGVVLVLGVNATSRQRIDALNSGADTVLTTLDPNEVVAAVTAVVRRSSMLSVEPLSQIAAGDIRIDVLNRAASVAGRALSLTPLEFDLLAYFVTYAGEALSRDRLLKHVWGYEIGGRDTVTVHVRRLRTKLEADPSRPTQLQTVWGFGYRLDATPTVGLRAVPDTSTSQL